MTRPLVPARRVEDADRYTAALAGFGGRVECVVPRGYPAYARILHPAQGPRGTRLRWAEVAAATGATLHPLAQFPSVAGRWDYDSKAGLGWPGANPREGTLEVDQLEALCRVLAAHTTTPDLCLLTVWEGWGNLPDEWRRTAPRIRQPHRAYYLFERPLEEVVDFSVALDAIGEESLSLRPLLSAGSSRETAAPIHAGPRAVHLQSPSQWWPEDRAWVVATEIDFDSTLVAGTEALVEDIVRASELEAFRVGPTDDLTHAGGVVNPPPAS